jgi:hypothetical protein
LNEPFNELRRAPMGAMAIAVEGQPFINSHLIVYDEAVHAGEPREK